MTRKKAIPKRSITKKIKRLVSRGITKAVFSRKNYAKSFEKAWKRKGYRTRYLKSCGVLVGDDGVINRKTWYMIAERERRRKKRKRRR